MEDTQYLEHVVVNVAQRKIEMTSDRGDYEEVQFLWDEEGREGFTDTWNMIKAFVPDEMYSVRL
ncbi:hypothetical protein SShM2_020 [Synechococcus phage S-ShM2]|uniref:Uncharacterized protein n=3 Tax=Ahtivirus sagseatwo TaxID=2734079 RepID=A0A1D7SJS9_9CAUD|nr:hypothetical protein SShM2_020 [Synechococcus phage S-ShM2]AGH57322.1 hypothetical protein CPLG_00068 [Cyanophage S-SSM2]AOO13131.1 hypothetical protein LIS021110_017 [Cyanophage S-RIM14]ADO97631.1 hypothetical protein SShM2_020 [Synechococcus phage S-ShM2]AOO13347.1 hypothetical protein LIS110610_017 [Cyanophage S-RIM14]AOO13563.1 hypothetical protein Np111211_017 [Cyanophage S-RIM14]